MHRKITTITPQLLESVAEDFEFNSASHEKAIKEVIRKAKIKGFLTEADRIQVVTLTKDLWQKAESVVEK